MKNKIGNIEKGDDLDIFRVVPRINLFTAMTCFGQMIVIGFLAVALFNAKEIKVQILEKYSNPDNNVSHLVTLNSELKVNPSDIVTLSRYVIERYDLKSKSAVINLQKLKNCSEEIFFQELVSHEPSIFSFQETSEIAHVENVFDPKIQVKQHSKNKEYLLVDINYTQVVLYNSGKDETKDKTVQLIFRIVNRKTYLNKTHLGGLYYGLVLTNSSDSISDI